MHPAIDRIRSSALPLAIVAAIAVALLVGLGSQPQQARGCATPETTLTVSALASYDSPYGRYIDGIVVNETTRTVNASQFVAKWAEAPARVDEGWISGTLSPGEWTTFRMCWPLGVPSSWTPTATAGGWNADRDWEIPLRVESVTPVSPAGVSQARDGGRDGARGAPWVAPQRSYVATITNDSSVTVSAIEVQGVERVDGTFLDAVFAGCAPDFLEPGESAQIEFFGKAETTGTPVVEVVAWGKERPVITLSADDLRPYYGSPIALRMELRTGAGNLITGQRTLKIYYFTEALGWRYTHYGTTTGVVVANKWPEDPTDYRATFWGDDRWGETHSAVLHASPRDIAKIDVPDEVRAESYFKARGRMNGGADSAGKAVELRTYRYSTVYKKWVAKGTYTTTADKAGGFYRSIALGRSGRWRVRAWRTGVGYTPYDYVYAKR